MRSRSGRLASWRGDLLAVGLVIPRDLSDESVGAEPPMQATSQTETGEATGVDVFMR
jgi:hypothetical protein